MHELSIAEGIVRQIEELALKRNASRVASVRVEVGSLSGVDPEALRLAFPIAASGTLADGARLRLKKAPAVLRCRNCGKRSSCRGLGFAALCGYCRSPDVETVSGRSIIILDAEIEFADRARKNPMAAMSEPPQKAARGVEGRTKPKCVRRASSKSTARPNPEE